MSLQQDIDAFFESIAEERRQIEGLSSEQHRKILLLSLLDTLAKCAFPSEQSNGKRFIALIDFYSGWQDKDRVSLPQLQYLLDKSAPEAHLDLKREVNDRISKWPHGRILRPAEADPLVADLMRFQETKELIKKARYAALLWTLRNFSIHEFRSPGYGFPISDDNSTPYYHCLQHGEGLGASTWELYFPWQVISGLVSSCSDNLKADFEKRSVNPVDRFDVGSSWFS